MRRPLFAVGVSWFFATWLAFFCKDNVLQLSFAAILTAVLLFLLRERFKYAYASCIIILTASIAFAGFWIREKQVVEPVLSLADKTVTVEGFISEAELGIRSMTYTMKASFTDYPDLPETTLIVRDFSGIEQSAGNAARFDVRLTQAPESPWYKSRGILLIGQSPQNAETIPIGKYRMDRALLRLRVLLSRNIYANLETENADVVSAMVLGLKNNLSPEIFSALGKSGTSHLLSVSGLHLSILSSAVLSLLRKLRLPRILAALITIIFSFLFSALVGFGAAVFRAFVMTAISLFAECVFSRRGDSLSSLGVALLICGVLRPHWSLGWGIWLSAGASLGIILYGTKLSKLLREAFEQKTRLRKHVADYLSGALGVSFAAYAFTLPVLFLMSGWISLVSPITNLLILPFVPVTILFGSICAFCPSSVPAVGFIAAVADISTAFIVKTSEMLSKLPFSTLSMDESWILIFFAGVCAMLAILIVFRADKRIVAYMCALVAVCFCAGDLSLAAANRGMVELVTLDGRDTAVLLKDNEAVIIGSPDAYEISTLLRYLTFRGVKHIPAVIASDSPDNVGSGLLRLSGEYDIDCVIAPNDAYIEDALARALPGSLVYSGGYAEITVLGNVRIWPSLNGEEIYIRIGKNEIVKIKRECDIIETESRIQIFNDGKMLLPKHIFPLFEPTGAFLFGESRLALNIQ